MNAPMPMPQRPQLTPKQMQMLQQLIAAGVISPEAVGMPPQQPATAPQGPPPDMAAILQGR